MPGPNEVLDADITEAKVLNPEDHLATTGKRLLNYVLDMVFFYISVFLTGAVLAVLGLITGNEEDSFYTLIGLLVMFAYYVIFESAFAKSPAKFITKTRVVTEDGEKPSITQILGRTLARFIPFEAFSFLGSKAVGWHDKLSKTRVINDR